MHFHLLVIIWRRKLSILLLSSILILIGLWSWAFYNTAYTEEDRAFSIKSYDTGTRHSGGYLLQKLISQANRVLQYQLQHSGSSNNNSPGRRPSGGVKFVAPTGRQSKHKPLENYLFEEERLRILQNQQQREQKDEGMDYERELTSAERQSQYEHELQRMGVPIIAGIGPGGPRPPNDRLVHLDLKGAPPKLSFLKKLLPIFKTLGATGLLLEYEDMFPYSGSLEAIAAKNAYKTDELKDFIESTIRHGLTIMPLVQTFGHLEYALKLQGFEHMREIPESPQSICPSQKVSMSFLEEMITQIVEFHLQVAKNASEVTGSASHKEGPQPPTSFTHIHIGCDEVFRMGECDKCQLRPRNELFLSHVTNVASFIKAKWPHLKTLIWDDMLRDMTLRELVNSHIGNYVEPMIWVYALDIYRFIQPQLWDIYSKVFPTAWAASAFKGAFGESLMIPPIQKHLENNMRWLAVIAKEGGRFPKGFRGIALTGWQRYDHFAVLCELLPTGMPSLITSLSTVSTGYFNVDPKQNAMLSILECAGRPDIRHSGHAWVELQRMEHHNQLFTACVYPGSTVYKFILRLNEKISEIQIYLNNVHLKSAWMSDYNVRHNFSSPLRVSDLTANAGSFVQDLNILARECYNVMYEMFDEHTIGEFVEQIIFPQMAALRQHEENGRLLMQRKTWPRRPLPYARDIVQMELGANEDNRD